MAAAVAVISVNYPPSDTPVEMTKLILLMTQWGFSVAACYLIRYVLVYSFNLLKIQESQSKALKNIISSIPDGVLILENMTPES
jgi:hypothetical protein